MDTVLTIRRAASEDLLKLKEIINLSFPRFFRFFASHSITSKEGRVIVGETQNGIVGFAKLTTFQISGSKHGCLLWLAVHPTYRRRGFAAQLVRAGTEYLKASGAKTVFASVQRRNKASLNTFIKKEFKRMGFFELWRLFGWQIFAFYRAIWFAPGEIVLMRY